LTDNCHAARSVKCFATRPSGASGRAMACHAATPRQTPASEIRTRDSSYFFRSLTGPWYADFRLRRLILDRQTGPVEQQPVKLITIDPRTRTANRRTTTRRTSNQEPSSREPRTSNPGGPGHATFAWLYRFHEDY
jgi:hypothetical protein